jgi:hypothetical protein
MVSKTNIRTILSFPAVKTQNHYQCRLLFPWLAFTPEVLYCQHDGNMTSAITGFSAILRVFGVFGRSSVYQRSEEAVWYGIFAFHCIGLYVTLIKNVSFIQSCQILAAWSSGNGNKVNRIANEMKTKEFAGPSVVRKVGFVHKHHHYPLFVT